MNILVLGTIDSRGGAAMVSWEIRKKLKALGHKVDTFVRYKYSNEPDVHVIPRQRWQDWMIRIFANDLRFARTGYIFETKEYKEADVIHCHNLHSNFFNLKDLIRMSREKPVVWTIHDLWPITGFASDSGTRNNPNKKRFLFYLWDNTARLLRIKERIYSRSKLTVVAVSEWIKKEIDRSALGKQSVILIYNGADTEIFKPQDKAALRRELGLPSDRKIVAFGLKGWLASREVMESYKGDDGVFFLAIGNENIRDSGSCRSFPYTTDKSLVSKYLASADVFLYPTQGDSFGLVAAESLACETPVVTTDVDALQEIVTHGQTGYISPNEDPGELRKGIDRILGLSLAEYDEMSRKGREDVLRRFSLKRMCDEYTRLYDGLLTANLADPK